jgi:hypothetical protein
LLENQIVDMKNFITIVFIIIFKFTLLGQTKEENVKINHNVDSLSIGEFILQSSLDTVHSLKTILPKPYRKNDQTSFLLINSNKDSVYVLVAENKIHTIICTDKDFKNNKGIGIGTTTQTIKNKYSDLTVFIDYSNGTEYILIEGVEYHFNTTGKEQIGSYSSEDPEYGSIEIKDNFKVDAIVIKTKPYN